MQLLLRAAAFGMRAQQQRFPCVGFSALVGSREKFYYFDVVTVHYVLVAFDASQMHQVE